MCLHTRTHTHSLSLSLRVNAADSVTESPESVTSQHSTQGHDRPPQRALPRRPIPPPKPAHLRVTDATMVKDVERSTPPPKPPPKPSVSHHTTVNPASTCHSATPDTMKSSTSTMKDTVTVAAPPPQNPGVTSAVIWKEVVHEASGRICYWNTETNATSWTRRLSSSRL